MDDYDRERIIECLKVARDVRLCIAETGPGQGENIVEAELNDFSMGYNGHTLELWHNKGFEI